MTIDKIRELLKVHIKAAECCRKMEAAFALTEVLDVIDAEVVFDTQRLQGIQFSQ